MRAGPWAAREAPSRQNWEIFLDRLRERTRAMVRPPVRGVAGEILYVIDTDESVGTLEPSLQVLSRTRKKNGDPAKPQPLAVSRSLVELPADERDREILALLTGVADPYGATAYVDQVIRSTFHLSGPLVGRLLPLLADTGRLYLRRSDDPARPRTRQPAGGAAARGGASVAAPAPGQELEPVDEAEPRPLTRDEGEPWRFTLEVRVAGEDAIRLDGYFEREGRRLAVQDVDVLLTPGFMVADRTLFRFEHGGALVWLLELRRSGAQLLPAAAAPAVVEAMARSGVDPGALPEALRYEVVGGPPVPCIRLFRPRQHAGYGYAQELEASLEFDYGGTNVPSGTDGTAYDPAARRMVRRDEAAEAQALQRLQRLGFRRPWSYGTTETALSIAVERFPSVVRTLVDEGWRVEADGRVFRPALGMTMQVKSGVDWFELHGQVQFGGGGSASIAELLAALRRGDATLLLDDGTRGMIPEEWMKRYARVASFGQPAGDHVRYMPAQTALLDALLEAQPSVSVDAAFARARAKLAEFDRIRPQDPPPTFKGRLREYQREALGWFRFLREFGFGGCLADDMGLGKTVMVLALLESRRRSREKGAPRTSLAVVPRSLVFNWKDEAAAFAPKLRVVDYTGEGREEVPLDTCDLLLTTYGTLRRDAARLAAHEFDYVILDEAQAIKNPATASAKAARLLRARHRLALSGTPIENHIGELWSLFEFLNPGFLGPAAAFGRSVGPQARGERLDLPLIGRALKPFILRRTKDQVAPELPEKTEQTIGCDLEPAERRFYDELRDHYRTSLLARIARSGLSRSKIQVLEALLRLRQAALHPGLVDPRRAGETSSKLELLMGRLREVIDEGHKALVFSQFTSLLAMVRARLEGDGIAYEYLDGTTQDRAARVARFEQDPACPVFLLSLKAGGVGLNLTAADYVFLLDPWWNPAVEAQAIDRTHRIGQARHVFAYRLIARDTVEEKIAELQQSKRELADAILGGDESLIATLRAEDLAWLLS